MFNWIKDTWNAITGSTTIVGTAEEITKFPVTRSLIKGVVSSIPFVGGFLSAAADHAHHVLDRAKDILTQSKLNGLSATQDKLGADLTTLQGSLNEANKHTEQLQSELDSLSQDNVQQRAQILEAIQANKQLKEYLDNSIAATQQNITEINSQIKDFVTANQIIQNDLLSEKEKIISLQNLATQEKERLNKFESNLQEINQSLKKQEQQMIQTVSRLEFLEKKIENLDQLQEQADESTQKIKELIEQIKTLQSEKDQKNRLAIIAEIQTLKKQENSLLSKLTILEENLNLFHIEKTTEQIQDVQRIPDIRKEYWWVNERTLSSITEELPLDSETYDYCYRKYGARVMKNWIRTEFGSVQGRLEAREKSVQYKEWKENRSLIMQALLEIQSKIAAKIALLDVYPELIFEYEEDITISQILQNIEQEEQKLTEQRNILQDSQKISQEQIEQEHMLLEQEKKLQEQLQKETQQEQPCFSWTIWIFCLVLSLILLVIIYFWKETKQLLKKIFAIIFSSKKQSSELPNSKFSFQKPKLSKKAKKSHFFINRKILFLFSFAFFWLIGAIFTYKVNSFYQKKTEINKSRTVCQDKLNANKQAQLDLIARSKKLINDNQKAQEELAVCSDELLATKRSEIISQTKVQPEKLTPIDLDLIASYLEENNYQFTNFLVPLEYRVKFTNFQEYWDYINSWNKKKQKKEVEEEKLYLNPCLLAALHNLLSEEEINSIVQSFGNLNNFFHVVDINAFLSFLKLFKEEKETFLQDKNKYPELMPYYSDRLFIELNSLLLSGPNHLKLEKLGIIPKKEEFKSFKLKKTDEEN